MKFRKGLTVKIILAVCGFWLFTQFFVYELSSVNDSRNQSLLRRFLEYFQSPSISSLSLSKFGPSFRSQGHGVGHMGQPVKLSATLYAESRRTFALHQFNLVASDLIGSNRTLPDQRKPSCSNIPVTSALEALKTSVIIVFHNEAFSTLLRTVTSVTSTSPPELLEEIILVDDASTHDYLGAQLESTVASIWSRIRVVRMPARSGLMRARLAGAQNATGKTLTFLDAHCETTKGWLEPLLAEIAVDRRRVACPVIDVIDFETFQYSKGSDRIYGTFDWLLTFHWSPISEEESARIGSHQNASVRTPAMAGGLFTIATDYFYELGSYDPGMVVWGVENIEMSLRIWQCGGELYIVPCSRVGHVFRKVSPYDWPGGVNYVLSRNAMRTASVWMDDYRAFYAQYNPDAAKADYGDVTERQELRKRLQCKSFRWYLENVFVNSPFPLDAVGLGHFRHEATGYCMDTMGLKVNESPIGVSPCHDRGGNQLFVWTRKGEIQAMVGCIAPQASRNSFGLADCLRRESSDQLFTYSEKKLIHKESQMCLQVKDSKQVVKAPCEESPDFYWTLPPHFGSSES